MTAEEAQAINERWRAVHLYPCNHSLLELETLSTGYLAGSYFCITCGLHVIKEIPVPPAPDNN